MIKSVRRNPGLHYMLWLRLTAGVESISLLHRFCNRRLMKLGRRYGFDIPYNTSIGGGIIIRHFGLIIINFQTVIGENFTVVPGTVIGKSKGRVPFIGDNVSVGANCSIIGGIKIGDGATIGAGSVVVHDVAPGSVVAGNPAKELRQREKKTGG